jgi:hypothetical protein
VVLIKVLVVTSVCESLLVPWSVNALPYDSVNLLHGAVNITTQGFAVHITYIWHIKPRMTIDSVEYEPNVNGK